MKGGQGQNASSLGSSGFSDTTKETDTKTVTGIDKESLAKAKGCQKPDPAAKKKENSFKQIRRVRQTLSLLETLVLSSQRRRNFSFQTPCTCCNGVLCKKRSIWVF